MKKYFSLLVIFLALVFVFCISAALFASHFFSANIFTFIWSIKHWGVIGTWFSGTMTLSAVGIALLASRYFEYRDRPKLEVLFDCKNDIKHVSMAIATSKKEHESGKKRREIWLTLRVVNKGKMAARDVVIHLIDVSSKETKRRHYSQDTYENKSIQQLDFKASSLNSTFIGLIPNKLSRSFDIMFGKQTTRLENSNNEANCIEWFLVTARPEVRSWDELKEEIENDNERNLQIGRIYRIHFAVYGSNADAVHYEIQFAISSDKLGFSSIKLSNCGP